MNKSVVFLRSTVLAAALALVGCGGDPPGATSGAAQTVDCHDLGQGPVHALDWSPNGRYLGIAKVARDASTEILLLDRQSGELRSVQRDVEIFDSVVGVDDEGAIYYERSTTPTTLVREHGEIQTWTLDGFGYSAFDWTSGGAYALVLNEVGAAETTLVSVQLGQAVDELELASWPIAYDFATSADGRMQVVAHADELGGETWFAFLGDVRQDVAIGRYVVDPIALSPAGNGEWLVRYNRTDTGSIPSVDANAQAGPELTFDFVATQWDFAADGAYAVSPFAGAGDPGRVCIYSTSSS